MTLLKPATSAIPVEPGVYRFFDANQQVIYVGKAANLRSRLTSYFADPVTLHPRTRSMVERAATVDWTIVQSEAEAFQLEYSWIKTYEPRFNVKYRDDKSYPYLAVTVGEAYPRAQVVRGQRRKATKYFGPYAQAWAIRETLDQLLRVFPVRTCSAAVFRSAKQSDRPCLLGYIDRCSAPCVGRVSPEEHRAIVDDLCTFMGGKTADYVATRTAAMEQAVADLDYERAARLRDDLAALEKVMERNTVVLEPGTDADFVAVFDDELEAAVQVFYVRDGRIRGKRGWVTDKVEDVTASELMTYFLRQIYDATDPQDIPKQVFVGSTPADQSVVEDWLGQVRGSAVRLTVPQRGAKVSLLETVLTNANETLMQHRLRRASDLTSRSAALSSLQTALGLAGPPLRIECIDISHLQGTSSVGSLVVFEDGLAKKSHYRRFTIKDVEGSDDVASIKEVVRRRFSNPDTSSGFAYEPGLLVVDGGRPQAKAAQEVLLELGMSHIPVVGLAKRLEEVWPAGVSHPVILSRGSEALFLLQRVRDEAHRFAISFHRQKRSKAMTASELDQVPGLGQVKRIALLKKFRSVRAIKAATIDDLQAVAGIGPTLAVQIHQALRGSTDDAPTGESATSGINTATGEIIET